MELRHFNYFWWDSEGLSIILHGTIIFFPHFFFPTFYVEVSLKEGIPLTTLDKWLKKATPDDTTIHLQSLLRNIQQLREYSTDRP
jgi:hypothetical protein